MSDYTLDLNATGADGSTTVTSTTGADPIGVTVSTPTNDGKEFYLSGGELKSSGVDEPTTAEFTFTEAVSNVTFEVFDVDSGGGWDDKITIIAIDADGNEVAVEFSDLHLHLVDGNTVEGDGAASSGVEGSGALDTVTVTIPGPIMSFKVVHDNGTEVATSGTVKIADISFDEAAPVLDGIVHGTDGNDTITVDYVGDPEGDMIDNDDALLPGEVGDDDIVHAGAGDDFVVAADGDDEVYGESGDDILCGVDGDDELHGGTGNDYLEGMNDNDTLFGEIGDDKIFGDAGDDVAYGGAGADKIYGGTGDDELHGGAEASDVTLNFNDLATGEIVGNQYIADGVTISSANDANPVMIFDTANPTGGDGDLATDTLGNVLILSEDGDSSDPDDEAHGGSFVFDFADVSTVNSLTFLDIEEAGVITLYDADGAEIGTVPVPVTGNNGIQEVAIDTSGVASMVVTINGSGAIDNLSYSVETDAGDEADYIDGGAGNDDIFGNDGDDVLYGDKFTTPVGEELLVNGDLEGGVSDGGNVWTDGNGNTAMTGTLNGWTTSTGQAEIWENGFAGHTSEDGGEFIELDVHNGEVDTIYQDVATENGQEYDLTFKIQQRVEGSDDSINVYWGGQLVGTFQPDGTDTWTEFTVTVTGTGSTERLEFSEQSGENNSYGVLLDDISLTVSEDNNDYIEGNDGSDSIFGGIGDDILIGGADADTIDGGADADTIIGGDNGDVVDGGSEGDDNDTLDLTGEGPFRIVGETTDADGNSTSGTIEFLNDDGDVTGTMTFTEIENIIGDLVPTPDGIVSGTSGDDVIDTAYTGDPEGDMIDNDDAILAGEVGDDDIVEAGAGDDIINAGAGNDEIDAGDDADTVLLTGEFGDDEIFGGDGGDDNDTLDASGTSGSIDLVFDGAESGTLTEGGNEATFTDIEQTVLGDSGDTVLIDTDEDGVTVDTAGGDDDVTGGGGDDNVTLGSGNDTADLGDGDDYVDGGTGDDDITTGDGSDTVYGGTGQDYIDTSSDGIDALPDLGYPGLFPADTDPFDDRDTVYGGDGDDTIITGDDEDYIEGGDGNDKIDAGFDADTILGGDGDDYIVGGEGSDDISGGEGNDTIYAGLDPSFPDTLNIPDADGDLVTNNGMDVVHGDAGDDKIYGADDADELHGDEGNDYIDGGIDDDTLYGGDGRDTLIGGEGDDEIFGGADEDTIFGGEGDTVDGGGTATTGSDYDTLDLTGSAAPGGSLSVSYDPSDAESGTVSYFDENGLLTGTLEFTEIENVVPCFTPGSMIATPRGEVPVQSLKVGDKVITRDNGIQEIRWMGAKQMDFAALAKDPHLKPILIQKGSLGDGLPERDMLVSPNHRMLVANDKTALYFEEREVLAAAKHLVNNRGIYNVETVGTTYIHFMFDNHEVVLSDGTWTESFQPGDYTLGGIGNAQRNEILELFPELKTEEGLKDYQAARRTLKKHEARLLVG